MNEELEMLRSTTEAIVGDTPTLPPVQGRVALDRSTWDELAGAGLVHLTLPADAGGSGALLRYQATVLRAIASGAVLLPLLETDLAGRLLNDSSVAVPEGPMTFVSGPGVSALPTFGGGWKLTGSVTGVAWGADSDHVAIVAEGPDGPLVACVPSADLTWEKHHNLAGEPRDHVTVDVEVDAELAGASSADALAAHDARVMIGRALLLDGAMATVLAMTIQFVSERQQFGRALSRFQVIQHDIASMAALAAAATAATNVIVDVHDAGAEAATAATTAAWSQAARSAIQIARRSHQLHGAIGFTDEHTLGSLTTRLWSWSQEPSNLGDADLALGRAATAVGDPWLLVTGTQPTG